MRVYLTIALTIFFTVVGQLLTKKGMAIAGTMPSGKGEVFLFLIKTMLLNPFVFGGLLMAVLAAMSWMMTLSRANLSFAYPFMSLAFPLVLILSGIFFKEYISFQRWIGLAIIMGGLFIVARS